MKKRFLVIIFLFFSKSILAQTAAKSDLATIRQSLNKLQVLGSVLYVAAHPDDENTRLLAYLAQEKHYRTGYLALTRGDGGQNLIGDEQGELLGLIRTQELMAARRVDGAEQFFTRANDFGFSKGPQETLKIWDKDRVLSDVVWVIRKFRPDVIICRFPTTGEGGHGHHTASAILAQEAFEAAANPKRFPEQLKYVEPWQAKRLLWNTFNFGGNNTTRPDQFKIDVGGYNPILGKSYGEIAAESRSNHKTQGFGTAAQRGQSFEFFKTILGDAPQTSLMDGVNTTWSRIDSCADIDSTVIHIKKSFNDQHPEKSVESMVQLLNRIGKVPNAYWRNQKTRELKNLIAACAGLWFESYTSAPAYAVGDSVDIKTQIINRSGIPVKLNYVLTQSAASKLISSIKKLAGEHYQSTDTVKATGKDVPPDQLLTYYNKDYVSNISQPYWLVYPHHLGTYKTGYLDDGDEMQRALPENIPLFINIGFNLYGTDVTYQCPVVYKHVDPAKGELYQPLTIAPPITATIAGKNYIYKTSEEIGQQVKVNLKAFVKGSGSVGLQPMAGWIISPQKVDFTNKNKGDEWSALFTVTPADEEAKTSKLRAVAQINDRPSAMGYINIHYDHIPNITLFPPADAKLVDIDLVVKGKKIGYINGAGDQVADALKQIGYDVHYLTDNEIMNTDLSGYDAIVTGVRAFNVDENMVREQPKLLEYVKNGGNWVVQYNTVNNLLTNQIGPYPFKIVNERVTDENAKVTFTGRDSRVLNYPNKITKADFEDWVQERGLYFASGIDAKYETPLEMHDAGESAKKGSLLVATYGKGRFVYTSLDFFRELPAGVPGAYRLFVNLLSK